MVMNIEQLLKLLDESIEETIKELERESEEEKGKALNKPECLEDTIPFMLSKDYKERFISEYYQLKIRYEKLKSFCNKINASFVTHTKEPEHDCPLTILEEQQNIMGRYLHILEVRAEIEKINLQL